jgi:hypothetical protein
MADARRPKKADYKLHGAQSRDPGSGQFKKRVKGQLEAVKAHQIPETATVDDLVKALEQRNAIGYIKTTELCTALVKQFGGLDEFAVEFKEIYDKADSKHLKARMFESIVKLITGINKTVGEEDPIDTLSDEDLAIEAKRMYDKFYPEKANGQARADVGRGIPQVPQADGGVGQAAVGSPEPVRAPPEDGGVPCFPEED